MGVDISRLERPIRRALNTIENAYRERGEEAVITSTYEGAHSAGSLHYCNLAVDIRDPKKDRSQVAQILRFGLGGKYDVVEEKNHIHIEYDPLP